MAPDVGSWRKDKKQQNRLTYEKNCEENNETGRVVHEVQSSVVLNSLHKIHVQIMTNVIILLIHEICMHRTIHIIKLLDLGILPPSHVLKNMTDDSFRHHC